jgi:hypothetical protein
VRRGGLLRSLRELQAPRDHQEGTRGFVLVPPILPHGQWEALAAVSQDARAMATMVASTPLWSWTRSTAFRKPCINGISSGRAHGEAHRPAKPRPPAAPRGDDTAFSLLRRAVL